MVRRDRNRQSRRLVMESPGGFEPPSGHRYAYVTVDEALVVYAHLMGLENADAPARLRDTNLLGSALARPQHAAHYEGADLIRQAATLLWGLVKNHPFVDGNKRLANLVATTFLEIIGGNLTPPAWSHFREPLAA